MGSSCSRPQKRLDKTRPLCYTLFVNFCLISFREIYQFINTQHSSPDSLGTTPVRLFYQMISEPDPILSAHFRVQFFSLFAQCMIITCLSKEVFHCQKYFAFLAHPFCRN